MEIKYKLIHALADGNFHSGENLGKALGISRSAVWKQIQKISELGLIIQAVKGKGYRLHGGLELLSQSKIEAFLSNPGAHQLCIFQSVKSTNQYMLDNIAALPGGAVCLAESQQCGRGRQGRDWISPFGFNIYFSYLCKCNIGIGALTGLSLVACVIFLRVIKALGFEGVGVKWPNDIFYQGKKLGGILLDVVGEMSGPVSVVIGLGLNVFVPQNEGEKITQPWIDIANMNQELNSRNQLVGLMINELEQTLPLFFKQGLTPFIAEWQASDIYFDQKISIKQNQDTLCGVAKGITDDGCLIMEVQKRRIKVANAEILGLAQ